MAVKRFGKIAGLLVLMLFVHRQSRAQPADIARLRATIKEKQAGKDFFKDTSYIDALNNLAFAYYRVSADSLFVYGNRALGYARNAGYARGEATALRQLGNGYKLVGNYTSVLSCYHQSLAIAEKINDHNLIARASINIALLYLDMGKWDEALQLAERARRFFGEMGDSLNVNKCLTTMGVVWFSLNQYDKALQYHRQALQIAKAMQNEYLEVTDNDAIGVILLKKGLYREAFPLYLHSYDYFSHSDDKIRHSQAATQLAECYLDSGQYPKALKYGLEGLQLAYELKGKTEMKEACRTLVDIYSAKHDYHNALAYLRMYTNFSDTLFNEQTLKNTARLEAKYEYDKIESGLKEEQAKKDVIHQNIVRNKEQEIVSAILVILFLVVLALVQFRSRKTRQKTNRLLEAKNREISSQKEEIEHQSYQLLLNNQQKDKLFSIIAHDLKSPLQSLNTVLDLLKARALSEAQINLMIEELRRDVDYSAVLVSNLLFWAESQLDGIETRPVRLNLQELARGVLTLFARQAAEKNILLRNELSAGLWAWADKDMLDLVLRNLVSNAVKFCRPGDTITISALPAGAVVEMVVADTGIGIAAGMLEKINGKKIITTFGTARERGTGLGLLLCREFVALNNGVFRIESEPGKGSRFFFTVPIPVPS